MARSSRAASVLLTVSPWIPAPRISSTSSSPFAVSVFPYRKSEAISKIPMHRQMGTIRQRKRGTHCGRHPYRIPNTIRTKPIPSDSRIPVCMLERQAEMIALTVKLKPHKKYKEESMACMKFSPEIRVIVFIIPYCAHRRNIFCSREKEGRSC